LRPTIQTALPGTSGFGSSSSLPPASPSRSIGQRIAPWRSSTSFQPNASARSSTSFISSSAWNLEGGVGFPSGPPFDIAASVAVTISRQIYLGSRRPSISLHPTAQSSRCRNHGDRLTMNDSNPLTSGGSARRAAWSKGKLTGPSRLSRRSTSSRSSRLVGVVARPCFMVSANMASGASRRHTGGHLGRCSGASSFPDPPSRLLRGQDQFARPAVNFVWAPLDVPRISHLENDARERRARRIKKFP